MVTCAKPMHTHMHIGFFRYTPSFPFLFLYHHVTFGWSSYYIVASVYVLRNWLSPPLIGHASSLERPILIRTYLGDLSGHTSFPPTYIVLTVKPPNLYRCQPNHLYLLKLAYFKQGQTCFGHFPRHSPCVCLSVAVTFRGPGLTRYGYKSCL